MQRQGAAEGAAAGQGLTIVILGPSSFLGPAMMQERAQQEDSCGLSGCPYSTLSIPYRKGRPH